ncbi:hypothetical protein C1X05_07085 [Laceyella sacchari]|jgi:uncharacterized protein (DUF3820 family)|uniref:SMI1/KNR4 family protein n=1 Tax=Laceyella tengchongensis TaxID=574699 RepID=A0AA45WPC4_9BACL|nr:SMI1/KNR4 family protein [Laceyella tengchongensis]AUS08623.1 hypothetical protein C1X05_07085 [Laceyella sacchari]MRG28481.1 hypothetical protein [Laceyella tengchongensis]SMP21118.1 hypothetical protein SAMN06265361_103483 [Laceyella tengchongensis]
MITWIKREEKMPVEQFDEVEARLEVQFPQDYVNWVQQYRRPESGHGHILSMRSIIILMSFMIRKRSSMKLRPCILVKKNLKKKD